MAQRSRRWQCLNEREALRTIGLDRWFARGAGEVEPERDAPGERIAL